MDSALNLHDRPADPGREGGRPTGTIGRRNTRLEQLLGGSVDGAVAALLAGGFLLLMLPVYAELARTVWRSDDQGHGWIILLLGFWLLLRQRQSLVRMPSRPDEALGWTALLFSLAVYALGRSQDIVMFAVGSQIGVIAALLLLFRGRAALRACAFALVFMLFMVPLPEALVATATGPLKAAVSSVAASLLHALGYPVGRSGVIIAIGPYQLLVADACAGLSSIFTLEALGMLYMNLMRHQRAARNVALALLLVPTAFMANTVRVVTLALVTYHFGDAAGQGFTHRFAGMVLFFIALALMLVLDKLLGRVFPAAARPA